MKFDDWNKPNGQFSVIDNDIDKFVLKIPVRSIHGVGEKTEMVLKSKKINTLNLNIEKTKKILKWHPKVSVEKGINLMLKDKILCP